MFLFCETFQVNIVSVFELVRKIYISSKFYISDGKQYFIKVFILSYFSGESSFSFLISKENLHRCKIIYQ